MDIHWDDLRSDDLTENPESGRESTMNGKSSWRIPIDLLAIFPVLAIPAPGFSRTIRESDWIL